MARTSKTLIKIQNAGIPVSGFFDTLNLNTGLSGTDLGFGVIEIDATASGGGYTVETPSGTVDGSNVAFTVSAVPVYIVADGVTYFENDGYTRSVLSLTLDVPPRGFIRSFHS